MGWLWLGALAWRLALSPLPGFPWDLNSYLAWGRIILERGPDQLYASAWCDQPPGFLYPVWLAAAAARLLSAWIPWDLLGRTLLKIPPSLADVGIGVLLCWHARQRGLSMRHARWLAALWLFNPAVWITSAVWGQPDSILMMWVLAALLGLGQGSRRARCAGAVAIGMALLTKPQSLLLLPLFALWVARHHPVRRRFLLAAVSLGTVALLALPFWGRQSWDWLPRLYAHAAGEYPVTSLNAFNVWALFGMSQPDSRLLGELSMRHWGLVLFGLACVWILRRAWRQPSEPAFMAAAALLMWSAFLWLTRMHERYLYYPLPFLLLGWNATRHRAWLGLYGGLSAMLLLQLLYALFYYAPMTLGQPTAVTPWVTALCEHPWVIPGLSLINLGLWGVGMGWFRDVSRDAATVAPLDRSAQTDNRFAWLWFALALGLYLVRLGTPPTEYFDEVHHVKTARQLLHGQALTEWTHPHLGKEMMALSMAVLGERAFVWRLPSALMGAAVVALVYLLGMRWGGRRLVGHLAAFLMLMDGLQCVMSRIGMLDAYAVCFILLAYLMASRAVSAPQPSRRMMLGLGLALGLAIAGKWYAFFAYGGIAAWLLGSWLRASRATATSSILPRWSALSLWSVGALVAIPLAIYLLSYAPYVARGHTLQDVWRLQQSMWHYHATITDTHPYSSAWWSWPLLWRPVWMWWAAEGEAQPIRGIVALGNPAVIWAILPAAGLLLWRIVRSRSASGAILLAAFCLQYLPWGIQPRPLVFFHHFYSALPFGCLAIAWLLGRWWYQPRARWIVWMYLLVVGALFWYFYPVLSGERIPYASYRHRMWWPRWI